MKATASEVYRRFLYPMDSSVFLKHYWLRRSLFTPGHEYKFHGVFNRSSFDAACTNEVHLKAAFADETGQHAEIRINAHEIGTMLAAGMTVCAAGLQHADSHVEAFCREIRNLLGLWGDFNCNSYLSPDKGGFDLHFDNRPAWLMQVEGCKRWTFSLEPAVKSPKRPLVISGSNAADSLPGGSLHEVVLKPGDMLYLPAGAWHAGQAIGVSLGLTISYQACSVRQLAGQLIRGLVPSRFLRQRARSTVWNETGRLASYPPEAAGHMLLRTQTLHRTAVAARYSK